MKDMRGRMRGGRNKNYLYLLSSPFQICIYLNRTASILDTSVAKPRRSFFLEEARPLFKTIHHRFSCLADLEKYWFQLQTVCLQTPIIVGE